MLNRTRQAHNYLSLSLMTAVGWHRDCNLHQIFSVIPSWHCPCRCPVGTFSSCPLSSGWQDCVPYCEHNQCLLLCIKSTFYYFSEGVHHMVTPASGSGQHKGRANRVEAEVKDWPQQPTPLKTPRNGEGSSDHLHWHTAICQANCTIKSQKNSSCHWS